MFDQAKGRIIALVLAALAGLAGTFALVVAIALWISMYLPPPAGWALAALVILAMAGGAIWYAVRPDKTIGEEGGDIAQGLLEVPIDAARQLIVDRPLAAVAMSSGFGVMLARRPDMAAKLVERVVMGII